MQGKTEVKTLYLLDDPTKDKHVHRYVLKGLAAQGFSPTIGYFYGDASSSTMATEGINAFSLGLEKGQFKGLSFKSILRLRSIIQKEGYSVIHCQRHRTMAHAALALPDAQCVKLLYTVRSTNVLRNLKRRFLFRLVAKRLFRLIGVSKAVRDYMLETAPYFPASKTVVIHNGVDVEAFNLDIPMEEARRFLSIPEKGFVFGIVARLKKAKCHDVLIRAFRGVVDKFPETILAIVGDGPLEAELKALAKELGLAQNVIFTGRVEYHEVATAMRAFDCFVHPSFREGLPVAVLEAMASSLPVITTAADGIVDIFEKWEAKAQGELIGRMLEPRDVEGLRKAMLEFRGMEPERLRSIGQNARSHVSEDFSRQKMVGSTVRIYQEAVNSLVR